MYALQVALISAAGDRRTCSVVSSTVLNLLRLTRQGLSAVLKDEPNLMVTIRRIATQRRRELGEEVRASSDVFTQQVVAARFATRLRNGPPAAAAPTGGTNGSGWSSLGPISRLVSATPSKVGPTSTSPSRKSRLSGSERFSLGSGSGTGSDSGRASGDGSPPRSPPKSPMRSPSFVTRVGIRRNFSFLNRVTSTFTHPSTKPSTRRVASNPEPSQLPKATEAAAPSRSGPTARSPPTDEASLSVVTEDAVVEFGAEAGEGTGKADAADAVPKSVAAPKSGAGGGGAKHGGEPQSGPHGGVPSAVASATEGDKTVPVGFGDLVEMVKVMGSLQEKMQEQLELLQAENRERRRHE